MNLLGRSDGKVTVRTGRQERAGKDGGGRGRMGKLRVDYTMGVDSMGAMDDGDEEITSIFVVSLHSVQDAQQGVALMMVIMLQLFLQLFGLNIGTTSFAKVHEISFEIWLRTAS